MTSAMFSRVVNGATQVRLRLLEALHADIRTEKDMYTAGSLYYKSRKLSRKVKCNEK